MSTVSNMLDKAKRWSNVHLNTGFSTSGTPGIAQALGYPSGSTGSTGVTPSSGYQSMPSFGGLPPVPQYGGTAGGIFGGSTPTAPTAPTGNDGSWWSKLSLQDKLALLGVGLNAIGGIGSGIAQAQQIGLEKQQLGLTREQYNQRLKALQQFRGGLTPPGQFAPQSPFGSANNP